MLIAGLCSTGCTPEVKEVDPAALNAVDHYVEELTIAILEAEPDLRGWVREPYAGDLPLVYDTERIDWLKEHRLKIEAAEQLRDAKAFPAESDILRWKVVVVRGENEWLLEGQVVNNALKELQILSEEITAAITLIEAETGELSLEQSADILELVEEIKPRIEAVREVFYK